MGLVLIVSLGLIIPIVAVFTVSVGLIIIAIKKQRETTLGMIMVIVGICGIVLSFFAALIIFSLISSLLNYSGFLIL